MGQLSTSHLNQSTPRITPLPGQHRINVPLQTAENSALRAGSIPAACTSQGLDSSRNVRDFTEDFVEPRPLIIRNDLNSIAYVLEGLLH
jgi:hypothetical protein